MASTESPGTKSRATSRNLSTVDRLRFGMLALVAVMIAAPGVHLFELWLDRPTAVWVSHGLAVCALAVVIWRWRVARARAT